MGFTKVTASGINTEGYFSLENINSIGIITTTEINVGSAVTLSGSGINVTGVITATSFSGDGSNLSNTGSTLSAASGSQRLVLTSQTSGTMTASSTDSDLTYNTSTDTLSVNNINSTGVITATSFSGDGSNITGLTRTLTIGVRTGAALTTNLTGSSFNVYDRDTNPISISI